MRITPAQSSPRRRRRRRFLTLPFAIAAAVSLSVLGLALAVGVIVGVRAQESGLDRQLHFLTDSPLARNVVDPALHTAKAVLIDRENVLLNCARGIAAENEVDRLSFDIKHVDYQHIAFKREQALQAGVLVTDSSDYVNARLTVDGVESQAKVRLKGDLPDHWTTDKWSLRVNLKGDQTALGMKTFSIQHPMTRDYANEWIALAGLRREGVLAGRYHFVDVTINGTHKGIYALEEFFDHRLIENAHKRAGPIVRFNESMRWDEYLRLHSDELDGGSFSSAPIDGFAEVTAPGSDFERAVSMLEGFRQGRLKASEIFDIERLGTFLAFKGLFGSEELDWNDFRFYYNPVTSRLEPIGFDMHIGTSIDQLFCYGGGIKHKFYEWVERPDSVLLKIFGDPAVFDAYIQALRKVSAEGYLDALFHDIGPELDRELSVLYREYPYVTSPRPVLEENQKFIRGVLTPAQALVAYHHATSGRRVELLIGNVQSLLLQPLSVSHPKFAAPVPLSGTKVLAAKNLYHSPEYVPVTFEIPEGVEWDDTLMAAQLSINYRIVGMNNDLKAPVFQWRLMNPEVISGDFMLQPASIDGLPWLERDEARKRITLRSGQWKVDRDVVIPAGYAVSAGPGVQLDLTGGAKIISYSAVELRGSEDHPIRIESTDRTGQGVLVIGPTEPSFLKQVVFENLGYPRENGWGVTSAVTFYETTLTLEDVRFLNNHCEDALNPVRSRFRLTRVVFADIQADAFDSDFSDGVIEQCSFQRCGNDAIDVSGSHVTVSNVTMDDIHDKGLSAGEGSEMIASDVTIRNSEIGVASKDLSTLEISRLTMTGVRVGFTVFQKKPEFGPATVKVAGMNMQVTDKPYIIEEGSLVTVDGGVIGPTNKDVRDILYGVDYGVNSKNTR